MVVAIGDLIHIILAIAVHVHVPIEIIIRRLRQRPLRHGGTIVSINIESAYNEVARGVKEGVALDVSEVGSEMFEVGGEERAGLSE